MKTTTIQLSDQDAASFVAFQRHYSLIKLFESLGVFELTNGSVQVDFDGNGKIGHVEIHRHYRP